MSSAVWTAAACGAVGIAVGGVLPRIGFAFAGRWSGCGPYCVAADPRSRKRILLSAVATASIMAWFGFQHPGPTLPAWCWMAITGVCLALVDIESHRLPRALVSAMGVGGLLVLGAAAVVEPRPQALITAVVAAGVVALIVVGVALAAPGHLGGGDITLYPVLALYLGWWGWPTVVVGMVAGAVLTAGWAIVLLIARGAGPRTRFPAGPMLILGAFVAVALATDTGTT